ncbi:MAG: hypothetical protein JNG88_05785 [Phycisphaerales bacterium]|nr:hypothetical protein [Phycisphaerales bacterium]
MERERIRRAVAVLMTSSFLSAAAIGDVKWVRHNPGGAEYDSIQAALDASVDGDVVIIAATEPLEPYSGTGFSNVNFAGKKVTIRSEMGPESCEIDLSNATQQATFIFDSGETAESVLQGITFNGHFGDEGVGTASLPIIECTASSPRIVNCRFVNRVLRAGGTGGAAIHCESHGNPVITHCEFVNNRAETQFNAGAGGAIWIGAGSSPVIQNCKFKDNSAEEFGGAIYATDQLIGGCRPVIANCIFENNDTNRSGESNDLGGAMYFENVNPSISNCLVFGSDPQSTAEQADNGSAIALVGTTKASIINCTIADTHARDSGATQIYFDATNGTPTATLTNCILYDRYTGSNTSHLPASGVVLKFCDYEGGPGTPDSDGNFGLNPQYYKRPDPPPNQDDPWAHDYYLGDSAISGQTSSPCRNAGGTSGGQTATAEEIGLAHVSTRTDLLREVSTSQVDLGFHITGDCNGNGQFDSLDILLHTVIDADPGPDYLPLATRDCNYNGIPDLCDVLSGASPDSDGNLNPDDCQCRPLPADIVSDEASNLAFEINVHRDNNGNIVRNTIATPLPYLGVALGASYNLRGMRISTTPEEERVVGHYRLTPTTLDAKLAEKTAVDLDGNVWFAYSKGGTTGHLGGITQVGLIVGGERCDANGVSDPAGGYVRHTASAPIIYNTCHDRNGDGLIATSIDLEDVRCWDIPLLEPVVDVKDYLTYADDECVCRFHLVNPIDPCSVTDDWFLGLDHPGHLSIDKSNNLWVGGAGNHVFNYLDTALDEVVDCFQPPPGAGGLGGLIDYNNVIWSCSSAETGGMLRCELPSESRQIIGDDANSELPPGETTPNFRGIALDKDGFIWVSRCSEVEELLRYDPSGGYSGFVDSAPSSNSRSLAITYSNNNLWVPDGNNCGGPDSAEGHTISRIVDPATPSSPVLTYELRQLQGEDETNIGPTGIAVDQDEKTWVTCYNTFDIRRVDPGASDPNDAVTKIVSVFSSYDDPNGNHGPSSYSDQTGQVTLHSSGAGTFTVVHDSGRFGAIWHRISWNDSAGCPSSSADERLKIGVRLSDQRETLATLPYLEFDEPTPSGTALMLQGRFVEVRVRFLGSGPGESYDSPTLCDLTIRNLAGDANCDGAVNNFDINPFVLALSEFPTWQAAFPDCPELILDCNNDGLINNFDIDSFVAILANEGFTACP